MKRTARCCCGKLSIEVQGEPENHAKCHCTECQQRSGSSFALSASFRNDQILSQQGNASLYSPPASDQQPDQLRYFCGRCGTTLFWKIASQLHLTAIASGCFNPPLKDSSAETSASCSLYLTEAK